MPDQPPGEMQTNERRISILYERLAALERITELTMESRSERMSAIEATWRLALEGKGGVLDRLEHLDKCVDGIKRTIWMATGALALISVAANLLTRH
jgi:hypothetical protein